MVLSALPIIGDIIGLGRDYLEGKRKIKKAIVENKIRLANNSQDHNQDWEMRGLDNAGWKDDILFYAILGMFVWAGIEPDKAALFFANLEILPEWFVQIFMWLVASIVGVKKIGDYMPSLIKGVKEAIRKDE